MSKLKKPTLLIDADIIAYRCSAACDGRIYKITYENKSGERVHLEEVYKKDALKIMDSLVLEGHKPKLELEYHPEPLANAIYLMKSMIKALETDIKLYINGIGTKKFFLSRGGSFREAEFPLYKANRNGIRRPAHLEACKDWLVREHGAIVRSGLYEADDMMAMAQDENSVICSIDKDLLQVPGHHFNFVSKKFFEIDEEEGRRNLYKQMLTGDTSDGIPGIRGIGPVNAARLLENASSEWAMYCIVLSTYLKKTPRLRDEEDEDFNTRCLALVRAHARLLYLLRSPSDSWEPPLNPEIINEDISGVPTEAEGVAGQAEGSGDDQEVGPLRDQEQEDEG